MRAIEADLPLFKIQTMDALLAQLRFSFRVFGSVFGIGVAGAFAVGQLMQNDLAQTSGRDPLTIAGIAVVMYVVSLAACFWPARRATGLDRVTALRNE